MSALRDWLLGVTAVALAVALAQALTPEGAVKKVGRLAGGLVLLLAVAKPLLNLEPGALSIPAAVWEQSETVEKTGEEVTRALIAEKSGAYIVDKGGALGVVCTAEVQVETDDNGWAVPWSVTVRGDWDEEGRKALSALIAEDLNIPAERQSFQKEGV